MTDDDRRRVLGALLLVILLALADLWSVHHLDFGLRNPGVLAVVLAAIGAAWGLVDWMFTKAERERAQESLRALLRSFVLTPVFILALYAVFFVAVLLFSSVRVVAEAGTGPVRVTVTRLTGDSVHPIDTVHTGTIEGQDRTLRDAVVTSPLAGAYTVRAAGYLPATVEALPLTGARLRLGRDVARSPSVLIRPAVALQEMLQFNALLQVVRRTVDGEAEVASSAAGQSGSFLLGGASVSPEERRASWEGELLALGVTDAQARNRELLRWRRPNRLALDADLSPGDSLVIRVVTPAGKVVSQTAVTLGTTELEDVIMTVLDAPEGDADEDR